MGTDGFVLACALLQRGVGLACAVVPPAHPPTFLGTGGHAVPPAGAAPPAPRLGNGGALPHLPLSTGERTRCACWTGGHVVACALHQGRVWLGLRRCPTGPPSNVFGNRGTPPVPPAGAAPPAPCWGDGGGGICASGRPDPQPNLPPSTGAGTEQPPHPAGRRSRACVGASGRFLTFRWVRG